MHIVPFKESCKRGLEIPVCFGTPSMQHTAGEEVANLGLATLVATWLKLPEPVRVGIMDMVEAVIEKD